MSKQIRSSYTVKNPHRDPNVSNERHVDSCVPEEIKQAVVDHLNSQQSEPEYIADEDRLCTCGSGELAYLCNGNGEDGWAYCG